MAASNVVTLRPASTDVRRQWLVEARVRFLRARRLIGSQALVAALLAVSVDAVQLWERGLRRVPAWALVAVEELVQQIQVPARRAA